MVNTLDFIFRLRKDTCLLNEVNQIMAEGKASSGDKALDIGGYRLFFIGKQKKIIISLNGNDPFLKVKFHPAAIDFQSMKRLLENKLDPDIFNFRYLDYKFASAEYVEKIIKNGDEELL